MGATSRRRTSNAERRTPNAERRMPNVERRTSNGRSWSEVGGRRSAETLGGIKDRRIFRSKGSTLSGQWQRSHLGIGASLVLGAWDLVLQSDVFVARSFIAQRDYRV